MNDGRPNALIRRGSSALAAGILRPEPARGPACEGGRGRPDSDRRG
jgi:hypothetical protein